MTLAAPPLTVMRPSASGTSSCDDQSKGVRSPTCAWNVRSVLTSTTLFASMSTVQTLPVAPVQAPPQMMRRPPVVTVSVTTEPWM